ncbi:TetR/AcrR family transcriptional regulator [Zoogloea sp. LCSB751]|uniref:TetR/AcrR family transcriptional regulator n=1 Tax=Zoogloea sp. LCSB751 TaxID=1965277 RepID=UPI0009A5065E|nr:TetR/AcrR family transcriptional regulator [Zoogloea sp. LCSB751]
MKQDHAVVVQSARTAPDKRVTIRRIVSAARQEFAIKGLANARIEVIAQNAGVTKQLVYHYFKGKTELFACVLDESSDDTMSRLVALDLDHLPPIEAVRAFLGHMFDQFHVNPSLGALAQEGIRFHASHATPHARFPDLAPLLERKLKAILARGAKNGDFKPGVDASLLFTAAGLLTTGVFTSPYLVSVLSGLNPDVADDVRTWRNYAVDFVISAISTCAASHTSQCQLPTKQMHLTGGESRLQY